MTISGGNLVNGGLLYAGNDFNASGAQSFNNAGQKESSTSTQPGRAAGVGGAQCASIYGPRGSNPNTTAFSYGQQSATVPEKVLFDFDQSTLRANAAPALARAAVLLKRSDKPVIVEGHTDNVGTHEYNTQLSEARATTVAAALEERGIAPSRIKTKGFAYDRPVASNDTPESQARNRRTEIVIVGESEDRIMGG